MGKSSHLSALFHKNMIILKRNCFNTVCELLFPMVLMILVFALRKAFKIKEFNYTTDNEYFQTNSTALTSLNEFYTLSYHPILTICKTRPVIALIGTSFPTTEITLVLQSIMLKEETPIAFKHFNTVDDINTYIQSEYYTTDIINYPPICFGIHIDYTSDNGVSSHYNVSLHYFATNLGNGIKDIPSTLVDNLNIFQNGPDMNSYERYVNSGYLYIMKIIYDYILQKETGNTNAQVNYGVMPMKYTTYLEDTFGRFIGFILPFFLVIAYLIPLTMLVSRMVTEKETKAKEGMKIMGLTEGTYFLSYFLQYFIQNILYSIVNSVILRQVFDDTGVVYLFLFFMLYGMNVFALAFFFQSMMDKTRLAMIVSILLYFTMYFVSVAVLSEEVDKLPKIIASLLPPTALQLGINTLAQFDSNGLKFTAKSVSVEYSSFSVRDMYVMFAVDIVVYLFLGYYLQNIISHEFGISRPVYFLCTRKYWGCCGSSRNKTQMGNKELLASSNSGNGSGKQYGNKDNNAELLNIRSNVQMIPDSKLNEQVYMLNKQQYNQQQQQQQQQSTTYDNYFQNENLYSDKTNPKDCLRIMNLRKEFDDGKVAVKNVNINLYKDEIFALLGHNGAGKSTTISMLSGLYEATSGQAIYDNMNILLDSNMDIFRSRLGICPQHDVLFEELTVEEHLKMFCVFKGVDSASISAEIHKSLKDFELLSKRNVQVKNLSAGQRRKLSISIALVGGSEVIFLDEPSSGMDITSRRSLWEILKQCTRDKIIVLTTHYMEEASVLGKRIGIISDGEMKCIGTPLFLIEKFGKYISITITKEVNAVDEDIIRFFEEQVQDDKLKYEVLSEEILFRIPKHTMKGGEFNIVKFFSELDKNVNVLRIRSYGAAMPTLEDVFLNVAMIDKEHKQQSKNDNDSDTDKILYDDKNYDVKRSQCSKVVNDLCVSLKKRMLQIIRDSKSFLLEILCPVLLVLLGLGVSSIEFTRTNPSFLLEPSNIITTEQVIYYTNRFYNGNSNGNNNINIDIPELFYTEYNVDKKYTFKPIEPNINNNNNDNIRSSLISFLNTLHSQPENKAYDGNNFCNYYFNYIDTNNNPRFDFITFVNIRSRQSAVICPAYMLNKFISYITHNKTTISIYNTPFQRTFKEQSDGEERTNSTLVFFVAVAFALIPANFITIIIKERERNSKHLQIISGISLLSYWASNYIAELIKYYFTGGINLLIIWAFGHFPKYLYVLYILYGPSMVSFTYLFSFVFDDESSAQNSVILVNFLFGALGGSVVLILRLMEDLTKLGKILAYVLRLVPSFAFCYGYNELLSSFSLFFVDYPTAWIYMDETKILKMEYIGMDCVFMGGETLLFMLMIIYLEVSKGQRGCCCCSHHDKNYNANNNDDERALPHNNPNNNINDSQVLKEQTRALNNSNENALAFSIKVKSVSKTFTKATCSSDTITAINDISFCLEYGECVGLLGINGAGKTTTFKCLTNELVPSKGRILINNKDINTHFHEVRSLIGYCPQFDAIFEYMTVYENLEFYAKIKGILPSQLSNVITALMKQMNLHEYKHKISGRLGGGNKRKLSVSIAMICNPSIVLLDEPSTGMDPEARRFMWSVIHKISTRSKRSSVLMTTHSMDEAETLCRRIAILVNGEFKCMGSSTYIKEKYGEGYEINLQITPMSVNECERILREHSFKKEDKINKDQLKQVLYEFKKQNFVEEVDKGRNGFAWKLLRELHVYGVVSVSKILAWCYYIENALKVINKVREYFVTIVLSEFVDNAFLFKVKRSHHEGEKSIGFLFGVVEGMKKECNIEEYSIQQTSLEQIFNKFIHEQEESNNKKYNNANGITDLSSQYNVDGVDNNNNNMNEYDNTNNEKVDIEIKEDIIQNILLMNKRVV